MPWPTAGLLDGPPPEAGAETLLVSPVDGEVQGWKHFDEIVPAWIKWWPHGNEDQTETMFVTAYEATD